MKIKTNDIVKLLAGKDRGKTGKVLQLFQAENRVVVEGVNKLVKHLRARGSKEPGKKIEFFGPMNISNLMLVCPKCKQATRVGKKILTDGKRVRVCRKCKETIE